jgi:putative peptide zinc metalloprotease protein
MDPLQSKPGESVLRRHRSTAAIIQPEDSVLKNTQNSNKRKKALNLSIKFAFLVGLFICLLLPYPFHVAGEAIVLPAQRTILSAEMDGMIEQIFFDSGDTVRAGAVVAQMANHQQVGDLAKSKAARDSIAFEIERLKSTPTVEEIASAKAKVNSAHVYVKYSGEELERAALLYNNGSLSTQELDRARQAADAATKALAEAEANLAAVRAQVNPNQIAALEAEKVKIEQEIVVNYENLRRTSISSSIAGQIVTKDLKYKAKSFVNEGEEFAVVEDLETVLIEVSVPEAEIRDVKLGARLRLRLWAYPDREFSGTVEQILPAVEDDQNRITRSIPVLGRISNNEGALHSGLTGQAKIRGETRLVVLAFTQAIVRFFLVEFWSWFP